MDIYKRGAIKCWPSHKRPGFWFWDCDFSGSGGFAVVDDFGDLVAVPIPGGAS